MKQKREANIKQTSSKRQANLEHTSCTCILSTFASCLLRVWFLV